MKIFLVFSGVLSVSFFKFYRISLKRLSSKKVENISISLIVAPRKFDVPKTSIFAFEANICFKNIKLSADSSSTETLYCFYTISHECVVAGTSL